MKIKMNTIIAMLVTFCLTASIFMAIPIESQTTKTYNPLADINEDGKVSLQDLVLLADAYGTNGTPVNITELQSEIDALNTTIIQQENTINNLNSALIELENTTNYLNATVTNLNNTSLHDLIAGITPIVGAGGPWVNTTNAADNNDSTYCLGILAGGVDASYMTYDLGSEAFVTKIIVDWAEMSTNGHTFKIMTSADGVTFTDRISVYVPAGTRYTDSVDLVVNARYIRVYIAGTANTSDMWLYSLQVSGG